MAHDAALDSGIFTAWSFDNNGASLSYLACGSTKKSQGCYASGTLSPFEHACAILDGPAIRQGHVLTRDMYILDRRTSKKNPILLDVYTRTDTFKQEGDFVAFTLKQQITLNIPGGGNAHCAMAAGNAYLFVGTSASQALLKIDRSNFSTVEIDETDPVASITADDRGFVAVYAGGIDAYGPDGQSLLEGGGGPVALINTRNALTSK